MLYKHLTSRNNVNYYFFDPILCKYFYSIEVLFNINFNNLLSPSTASTMLRSAADTANLDGTAVDFNFQPISLS